MARYDPSIHHRRSIRLKGYDYSQAGAYFVTICTQNRQFLLEPEPVYNMIYSWWERLPGKFPNVDLDEYVVMSNHAHGIILLTEPEPEPIPLVGANPCVRPDIRPDICPDVQGQTHGSAPTAATLGDVVQWFKTMTTNAYIRGVKNDGWQPFPGKLWQRNYYERIIRSEEGLDAVRNYIRANPLRWHLDAYNPHAEGPDPWAKSLWELLEADRP